ncbi:Inositol polyphosphate multikinase [Clonorchis sinensis]|uniref:Kinase n=1 Tax=Clonorchis sinensis TaxID=79923 RepID=A0A8T1M489_CLOSI|nr:Inositol polyphosphate multikinase [Clonorchis sinensis]
MCFGQYASLPDGLVPYSFQVAGHTNSTRSGAALLHRPGIPIVYKSLCLDGRGQREAAFYREVYDSEAPETLRLLRKFLPQYIGVFQCLHFRELYLGLSDLFASLSRPNICDFKLGTVSYGPNATQSKITHEDSKYIWRRTLGFLLCGMQIHDSTHDTFFQPDKNFCRSIAPHEMLDKVMLPFLGPDPDRRSYLSHSYVQIITNLLDWFEDQGSSCILFCCTSLLLGHDTVDSPLDPTATAKLVDFSHWIEVKEASTPNSPSAIRHDLFIGFAHGLRTLRGFLVEAVVSKSMD